MNKLIIKYLYVLFDYNCIINDIIVVIFEVRKIEY